jgi:hypothetical protein
MRVRPLRTPVPGEHLIAVEPALSLFVAGHWRRRLNLFTGRSLTQAALDAEQAYRAGMLSLRGLSVSPGVVEGLEADLEIRRIAIPLPPGTRPPGQPGGSPAPGGTRPPGRPGSITLPGGVRPPGLSLNVQRVVHLSIAGGYGIGASGEDVLLPRPLRVAFNAVTPFGSDEQLRKNAAGEPAAQLGELLDFARAEAAAGRATAVPQAGVLVLAPARFGTIGEFDPESQCEIDPESFPFEDQQVIDGCRLLLHLWPQGWSLPARDPAGQPDRWRNRLAYDIFERERQLAPGDALPWDRIGVPLALIGLDAQWNALFADRAAVARAGGRPRRRGEWIRGARNRFLAQARLEQLAEQLAEPDAKDVPAATLAARFAYLPPAGLLPRDAWDFGNRASAFFPAAWRVDAVPVPLEQLDATLEGAALLARFDADVPDDVEILVPVPQIWFEPRLLEREEIDAEFDQAIARFRRTRDEWLHLRENLRHKAAGLVEAVTAGRPAVPPLAEDPEALEPEPATPQSPPGFRAAHVAAPRPGMHQHFFDSASGAFAVGAGEKLFAYVYVDRENPPTQIMLQWHDGATWEHRAYWGESRIEWGNEGTVSRLQVSDTIPEPGAWVRLEVSAPDIGLGAPGIRGMAFTLFDGRVAWGAAGRLAAGSAGELVEQTWFDGELPPGALAKTDGGDAWRWIGAHELLAPFEDAFDTTPAPAAALVHRSPPRAGLHQHLFDGAAAAMSVQAGDRLYAWILTDPKSPPAEIMLQWRTAADWNHRAYWGANLINEGTDGTAGRRAAGALPAPGRWTRLEISAEAVGLAGQQVRGMALAVHDGGAVWGPAGRIAAGAAAETPFLRDALPAGATPAAASGTTEVWSWRAAPAWGGTPAAAPLLSFWYDLVSDVLSDKDRKELLELGLERFVPLLESRIDKAEDVVNLGFARLNVNAFRLRQVTLGSTAASRLAVSPVYAQIARSETAVAATQQVTQLAQLVKDSVLAQIDVRDVAPTVRGDLPDLQPAIDLRDSELSRASGVDLSSRLASAIADAVAPPAVETRPEATTTPVTEIAPSATGQETLTFVTPETTAFGNINLATTARLGTTTLLGTRLGFSSPVSTFGANVSGLGAGFGAGMMLKARDVAGRAALGGAYTAQMKSLYSAAGGATAAQAAKLFTAAHFLPPVTADKTAQERIAAQAAIPGTVAIRSTTIAERMAAPAAPEARNYALAARHDIVAQLLKLEISLAGIELTGIATEADKPVEGKLKNFGQPIRAGSFLLAKIDTAVLDSLRADIDPTNADEPSFVVAGIDLADHTIVLLRRVEGRIREYRLALEAARQALAQIKAGVANVDRRLQVIGTELAEARHDVAVSLALKAEEQARLDAINARREQIVAEQVKFLAYRRPRWTGNLAPTPARRVDPALTEAPVPACLARDHEPPEELRAMIDLAREAPARWYTRLRPLLDRIARIESLIATFEAAQARTRVKAFALPATRQTLLGTALTTVLTAQHHLLAQRKQVLMQVDTGRLAALNWKASRAAAEETVSLADLMEGAHRRADLSRQAADEVESISRIAACLHAEFAAVRPAIRLDWAERVSQFDAPVSLRNLSGLAHWDEIGYIDRRQMQAYVDWLFDRVDAGIPEAAGLMNDLVRVCLLLASHAPVGQIVAGRVAKPQKAAPGGRITLRPFDLPKVKIGMQALLYSGAQIVARAVVDDLGDTEVSAQVLHAEGGTLQLAESMTVHFAERAALGMPLQQPVLRLGRK